MMELQMLRIAAVGDIHYNRSSTGRHRELFRNASHEADVLCLCGDLTDYGTVEEAETLAADLQGLRMPMVAVLGNHDFHGDQQTEVRKILESAGVRVLEGEDTVIRGVAFVGAKGFCGGFGHRALEPWGEHCIKAFVQETIDEALALETALSRHKRRQRVVVLHYSPVEDTVRGEPEPIYPFLGSSRLEDPIDRYGAAVVFHGHAHRGSPEGRTRQGVPVYNVAHPLLRRIDADGPGYRLVEVPILSEEDSTVEVTPTAPAAAPARTRKSKAKPSTDEERVPPAPPSR